MTRYGFGRILPPAIYFSALSRLSARQAEENCKKAQSEYPLVRMGCVPRAS
jgi:hypothetical protein